MQPEEVLLELETLGTPRTKKIYLANGAREPLFGVATGAMKPLARKIKKDQPLAEALYATGNYDAMYFAGVIADPAAMGPADFERWVEGAYFPMLSDFVVAVTLAEADCAQEVADRWIDSDAALRMSAGWSCYEWLLGWRKDEYFGRDKVRVLLERAVRTIGEQPDGVRHAMEGFAAAVGVSYAPLHEEALAAARAAGLEGVIEAIEKAVARGKVGFKRRAVRC